MSANSSTSSTDSHHYSQPYSIYSLSNETYCMIAKPGCFLFTIFTIVNILLLLPLCICVLYHGLQRWQKQRSSSSTAAAMTSHSDSFTYQLAIMEVLSVFGCILCCCGIYMDIGPMLQVWYYASSMAWYGELIFHLLTCVEHYLAVVHPITYLSLRKQRWIRIRNIITGFIWLLCFGFTSLMSTGGIYVTVDLSFSIISTIIISFCCLSVLCVLIHPGPGDQGRDRVRLHQSKKRGFYTILAILGVLLLRCIFSLVWTVHSVWKGWIYVCTFSLISLWINFPGGLMLPLLYLHKTGMLAQCKTSIKV